MKNMILKLTTIAMIFTLNLASAACFDIVGREFPTRIGNTLFGAKATKVCIQTVNGFGGRQSTQAVFSDSEGPLAISGATLTSQGRCPGFCRDYTLDRGNANGANVDFSGSILEFKSEPNQQGTLVIKYGRAFPQQFTIQLTR